MTWCYVSPPNGVLDSSKSLPVQPLHNKSGITPTKLHDSLRSYVLYFLHCHLFFLHVLLSESRPQGVYFSSLLNIMFTHYTVLYNDRGIAVYILFILYIPYISYCGFNRAIRINHPGKAGAELVFEVLELGHQMSLNTFGYKRKLGLDLSVIMTW